MMSVTKNKIKTPWPTKDVMTQIYNKHLWGGEAFDFYSGAGSHDPLIVEPYIKMVSEFFQSNQNELIVCDLGCGDFNIGAQLFPFTKHYIGIDIVAALVERNKTRFMSDNLEFHCLDISNDRLPDADCIILRQVLQHLSNDEVLRIVKKLSKYKYVILTEHLPFGNFKPNADIISGQGIRIKKHSGLDLLKAPFHFKVSSSEILNEVVVENKASLIRTVLFTL